MGNREIRKDIITEMQYGNGAIKTCGKILLSDIGKRDGTSFDRTLLLGVMAENLLSELDKKHDFYKGEMWEVELIIIPKRKFIGHKDGYGWDALTPDQKLASGWDNKDMWEKQDVTLGNKINKFK